MNDVGPQLTAEQASGALVQCAELVASEAGVFWLESDPGSGFNIIHVPSNSAHGSAPLTDYAFGVRSNVNGYGGGALCAAPDRLFAVESSSQQIYTVVPETGSRTPLTNDAEACFGGLVWDAGHRRLLAVREAKGSQQLIAVEAGGDVKLIHSGEDFYGAPAVSADGTRMAWCSWSLPDMPWISSTLWLADVKPDGELANAHAVPTPVTGCVQQPVFDDDRIQVVSDHAGWWQPWQWSEDDGWSCLTTTRVDHAAAPWQLGEIQHMTLQNGGWVRVQYHDGVGELWLKSDSQSAPARVASRYSDFRCLHHAANGIVCIARAWDRLDSILLIHPARGGVEALAGGEWPYPEFALSPPEIIRLSSPVRDTATISGFYYAPVGRASDSAPPLVMIAHGGPTSMVYPVLNPQTQYFCHQGFAVVEVNYRGSSGFGREFRMALAGQWGILDVIDMERMARHLMSQGKADPGRIFIQGRSSGGYTALMAMISLDCFAAGVSQCGVSDPERLKQMTHRFESGYLDWLLGPQEQNADQWRIRSPLLQASRIKRPMAFFQGGQDSVVVPEQTQSIVAAMSANGLPPMVRIYPEEGHGFRKADNQADMLKRIAAFYQQFAAPSV